MEIYRKQMDKRVLEQLKDKIQIYLKSKGLRTADFIRENMDKVAGLYVENSVENGKVRMESRGEKPNRPSEIMIDKGFAILDEKAYSKVSNIISNLREQGYSVDLDISNRSFK